MGERFAKGIRGQRTERNPPALLNRAYGRSFFWDGNGTSTIGLFDAANSRFFLRNSNTPGVADLVFRFGPKVRGWLPIAGDWDGPAGSFSITTAAVSTSDPSGTPTSPVAAGLCGPTVATLSLPRFEPVRSMKHATTYASGVDESALKNPAIFRVTGYLAEDTNLRELYDELLADDINEDGTLNSNHKEAKESLTGQTVADEFFEGFDEFELFLSGKALRDVLEELAVAGAS